MTRQGTALSNERGIVLIYVVITMVAMLLFTGLAVDTGRAYVVKAQLSKAVDGAALGAARNLNSGNPKGEATRIFKANFPAGYLGTTSVTDPTTDPNFFSMKTVQETGLNIVTVTATAKLPTTFMQLANFHELEVSSSGEATRRMVDLSLVLDVSGSIGSKWPAVRDAARTFVEAFDKNNDRMALVTYGSGARVLDPMPASRGFDKTKLINDIPTNLPGGSTIMVEGLYRGWDELRSVPAGSQSGLRVIVLFTDGASNNVPGIFTVNGSTSPPAALRTADFPNNEPDPDNMTHDDLNISGLADPQTGNNISGFTFTSPTFHWDSTSTASQLPRLPLTSYHPNHRSSGIPTSFPLQTSSLTVRGAAQNVRRGLRGTPDASGRYRADIWNINNASRNLVEIIANAARSDTGDYRIRIFTIGMGNLVRFNTGTLKEKSEEILMRAANDKRSPDFNPNQLEGKYYFAQTEADVGPAFQQLQNQIVRLSK